MTSIRGAITVEENTSEAILAASRKLLLAIIKENNLVTEQIVDVIFSATKDLDAVYPAVSARSLGIVDAGLFCVQEMDVLGSLPMCLRILMHVESAEKAQAKMQHIYLEAAVVLRPDLAKRAVQAVAIDGPSGAGKSTVARAVAAETGLLYVDTGAMYRAVALHNIKKGVDLRDEAAVAGNLADINIDIRYDSQKQQRLILNSEDVTEALRSQRVAEASSIVASYDSVRQKLVRLQQDIAKKNKIVMDGRDIGTNVLPNADVKIYLDASLEERVRRRLSELQQIGETADFDTVKREVELRDNRDINRRHAPLRQAKDAIYINSDGINAQAITQMIIKEMKQE